MAKKTFEMAMKQLEQIVQELETGDIPLEKAIKKFEEGIQISKYCSEKLDASEKKNYPSNAGFRWGKIIRNTFCD